MITLNRTRVLNTLIKHETLTRDDLGKEENLGLTANEQHLTLLLEELEEASYIEKLNGTCTYTITEKGIEEGRRLNETEA
jgi:predicted transcriptional regulator